MVRSPRERSVVAGTVSGDEPSIAPVALEPRVLAEQVRMLYGRAPIAQLTVVVNAFLVSLIFWGLVPPALSIAWVVTLCALAALRIRLVRAYRRRATGSSDARNWARRFATETTLTGVGWGTAALVFYTPQSPVHQVFLAFVLGGMTAGAASSNASYTPAFIAFAAPALLPMVVRLSAEHDAIHAAMAFMLTLFGVAVTGISRSGSRAVEDAIRLRLGNEVLVDGLTAAQQRLESLNADLERRVGERTAELERTLALRSASEARLTVTLRSIGDAVIATDQAGRVTLFNGVAQALTGWKPEEAVDRPLQEVLHVINEGTHPPAEGPLNRVLGDGVVVEPSSRVLVARDGTKRFIAETAAPIRDKGGRILGTVLVFRDQTKERQAEESLRLSEQRLRALTDSMTPLAWTARPDGYITWYNQRWYEYTGTTLEQTEGWGWQRAHDPMTLPEVQRRWKESIATGTTFDMEFPLRGADGQFRRFLTRVFPLKGPGGSVTQWFGTHTDVTDLVEAHEALREADRRKTQFIAVLSHELRNPLAPIQNCVYLLDRAAPGSEQAAMAREIIHRQTEHLTRLVDDLLDVTRISRGKIELRRVRLDVREVTRRTCDDHRALFQSRGLELRVETSGALWIDADETRITQVIGNLLQNAAKFSRAGGTVIASVGEADGEAVIRVRDDGIGMAQDLLPRVFEPFVQAEGGLARSHGGLGLGLALAKSLVELHGGRIHACSEGPGRGSEFVVSLPLTLAVQQAKPGPVRARGTRTPEILVIEDNVDEARSIAGVLEVEGYRVHVATDGRSGIAKAHELRPGVILCDIGLPDVDGYEIARTLRIDERSSARLIALSGYAQPEDRRRAREAGFDAHIAKPPSVDALLDLVAMGGDT